MMKRKKKGEREGERDPNKIHYPEFVMPCVKAIISNENPAGEEERQRKN